MYELILCISSFNAYYILDSLFILIDKTLIIINVRISVSLNYLKF